MGSWEEQQSQAEYPGCPWDPKRIFYRRHWEDSGATLQPLQLLLICKQPLSHHVFCKTHTNQSGIWLKAVPVHSTERPVAGMEPLQVKRGWVLLARSLLAAELDSGPSQRSCSYPSAARKPLDWWEASGVTGWQPGFMSWLCLFPLC